MRRNFTQARPERPDKDAERETRDALKDAGPLYSCLMGEIVWIYWN